MSRDGGLGPLLRRHVPEAHWQMVETFATGRGVPDANYCLGGREGWVELKLVTGRKVGLAPEQVAWAEQRTRAGGRVSIACRKGDRFWLFPAEDARRLMVEGVEAEGLTPLVFSIGSPSSWNWDAVRKALRRPLRPQKA